MFSNNFKKGNIHSGRIIFLFQFKGVDNSHINYKDIDSSYDPFKLMEYNSTWYQTTQGREACISASQVISDEYIPCVHLQIKDLPSLESFFFPISVP